PEEVTVTTTHSVEPKTSQQQTPTPVQPVEPSTEQEIPATEEQETQVNEQTTANSEVNSQPENPFEKLLPQDGA
ncbi:serine/threonine protein kinase, partial [Corynebacterium striatum]